MSVRDSRSAAECTATFMSGRHGLTMPSLADRVQERTLDIANRLRFACAHMSGEDLLELATKMAVVEIKYAGGAELQTPRRRVANG